MLWSDELCVFAATAQRSHILASAEDDIIDVDDDDDGDLDASVETDEAVVNDDVPATGQPEPVSESTTEKVSACCISSQ